MSSKGNKTTIFQAEVEKMTAILSKEIYSGNRLPHEHLIEVKLSENYKVSRMVIRQVLTRLESFGLVVIEPYKGANVAPITIERIRSEYEIVGMLEGFATKLATINMSNKDIEKLEKIYSEHKQAKDDDKNKWQLRNRVFHRTINQKCGNRKLMDLIAQHIKFTNYWFLSFQGFPENIEPHKKVLQAIKKRDAETARRAMESHLLDTCDTAIKNIQTNIPIIGAFRSN
jgi:DNA-binding GntR family transcriptional regulator